MFNSPNLVPTRPAGDSTNAPATTEFVGSAVATAVSSGISAIPTFSSSARGLVPASGGGTTNYLRADATFSTPPNDSLILQLLQDTYDVNTNLTTTIPGNDTVPTTSDGTEVLSQAVTVGSSTNRVLARVNVWGAVATNSTYLIAALFRGSTCINVAAHLFSTSGFAAVIAFEILDTPGSAASHTYSVRVGASTGNARLNGGSATRLFGGASKCTLTLMEMEG